MTASTYDDIACRARTYELDVGDLAAARNARAGMWGTIKLFVSIFVACEKIIDFSKKELAARAECYSMVEKCANCSAKTYASLQGLIAHLEVVREPMAKHRITGGMLKKIDAAIEGVERLSDALAVGSNPELASAIKVLKGRLAAPGLGGVDREDIEDSIEALMASERAKLDGPAISWETLKHGLQ